MNQSNLKSPFLKTKNFQRHFSKNYGQILWKFEKNLNIGDLAMIFPNPDKNPKINPATKGNAISSHQAEKHFDRIIESQCDYNLNKKFIKLLRATFLEVFNELTDFVSEKKENYETSEQENASLIRNTEPKVPETNLNGDILFEERKTKDNPENIVKSTHKDGSQINKSVKISQDQKNSSKINKIEKPKNAIQNDQNKFAKLKIIAGGKFYKLASLTELEEENHENLLNSEFQESKSNQEKKNRQFKWVKTSNCVMDFMTLLRQTVYLLLSYHGIVLREFLSVDENLIIAVCYGDNKNIKNLAEIMGIQKAINLSIMDLMSLEPVDQKLRPLRINALLWNKKKWECYYKSVQKDKNNEKTSFTQILTEGHVSKKSLNVSSNLELNKKDVEEHDSGDTNQLIVHQIDKVLTIQREMEIAECPCRIKHDHDFEFGFLCQPRNLRITWRESKISIENLRKEIHALLKKINYKSIVRRSFGMWEKSDYMSELT